MENKKWKSLFKEKDGSGFSNIQQDRCPTRTSSDAGTSVALRPGASTVAFRDGSSSPSSLPLRATSPQTGPSITSLETPRPQTQDNTYPAIPAIQLSPPETATIEDGHVPASSDPPCVDSQGGKEEDGDYGRLWTQAYSTLESDKKSKSLVEGYKILLNGDIKIGDKGYRDPAQHELMTSLVEEKLKIMTRKQWTLPWGKTSYVVREQAEKIVKIVQQFSGIGTVAASLDPTHAGIAWAGVCTLLPLILNDFTEQEKAMDGLEEVSKILARYSAVEKLLPVRNFKDRDVNFEQSIVALYATVLKYQATAACHFGRKTLPRMFANIITANDWTGMLKQVRTADNNCQAFIAIKSTQEVLKQIQEIPQGFDRELYKKWQQDKIRSDEILRQWINNRIEASEAHQEEIEKIISWISDVKVGQDHAALREKLGASYWNSGQWLLNPSEGEQNHFENWKLSRHGQLWLQGSVGTGKSSLVSIVINHLIESSPQNRLAFYYCSRNSAENTPVTILRGLVAQLAWSADGLEISDHVKKMYKKQSARRLMESPLSISDCVDLFVTLIKLHGPTIVVIDGLDECEGPMKLLWKLFEVWSRSQQLKVFLSSREGVEVTKVFSEALIIRTESEKSSDDIRKYITNELNRKERRNETVISEELAGRMVSILTLLAEGMFRWVELQLDLFISLERPIKHWKDFDDRLKKLEHDHDSGREVVDRLGETYEEIFQRNVQGAHSQRLAVRALQWVLCAFRPFDIQELRAAIAVEDLDVTVKLLLDLCSNFIHVDSKGFVRLAHISVKEYLEMKKIEDVLKFSYVEAHAQAAMTCFLYWSCAFEKEIGPPIRKEALLRTGSLFLKQIVSQQPPSFDKDKYIRKRCTALTCSEKVQGMEETALGEAATASWRCYASLYWASHYENATGDTLDQTSESMLKRKLSSFLDGRQYNIALINWVKEMAQLRYAFRQNGAGLGDRTPSPGPVPFTRSLSRAPSPFHVNYQISHITTKARVPPAAALPNPGRRGFSNTSLGTPVTSPSYLGRVVWDPTQALDAAQSRPHTRSIPRPRYHSLSLSPASSCKGREKEEKHPKEEMEFQRPREKKRALEGKKRIEKEAKEAGVQSRLEEVSRKVGLNEQLTAKEETKIWEAPLYLEDFPARMLHRREISPMTKKRHIKVEPRQKWYTSSSSDSSTTPSREVSAQPKSGRRYGGRPLPVLWLSDFAYDKDRTVFWDQWQDVSNFPPEGVEKGIRRIAFLTACLYGFEDVVSSVCNLKRCVRYRSHKGHSGLQLAARNGFLGIVRLLVEHGMKDEVDAGTTALHEACEGGHINVIECLLSAHFPPNRAQNRSYINTKDINGRSPLHLAAENDQSAIVVLLLQQPDIDVNARDQFRATSLRAAWKYSKKTLGILLEDPRVDTQIEDIYGKKYNDA